MKNLKTTVLKLFSITAFVSMSIAAVATETFNPSTHIEDILSTAKSTVFEVQTGCAAGQQEDPVTVERADGNIRIAAKFGKSSVAAKERLVVNGMDFKKTDKGFIYQVAFTSYDSNNEIVKSSGTNIFFLTTRPVKNIDDLVMVGAGVSRITKLTGFSAVNGVISENTMSSTTAAAVAAHDFN